ncbi:sugar nucleotide-binding protein [uncultured Pseudoteredinibacter sp.]|uniref:SDR family oxidoreductase n=1 Tax=uncultured Pseudoteredinibacter sp. TaxID=1641701 RepID=UPI002637B220|nr:sugar nucleotide-binding protein [uncultured Pseudoteredinibacter sp.]
MAQKIILSCDQSIFAQHLIEALQLEPFSLKCLPQDVLAAEDSEQKLLEFLREEGADLLINTLAYSVGDDPERRALLISASEDMASAAKSLNIPIVQLSTHEVFGGENLTVYREDDHPSPLTALGQALWDAERKVELQCEQYIVYRLSWLICHHGDSVFTRLLDLILDKDKVAVSAERRASPTFIDDACRVLVAMIKQIFSGAQNWGIYHYASSDPCDEKEFAEYLSDIVSSLGHQTGQLADDSSDVQYPSAVLGCISTRDDFGVQQRSWRLRLESRVKAYIDSREIS